MEAEAETRADPVAAFARVFAPLCTAWFFWVLVGHRLRIGSIRPIGLVLAPVVLFLVARAADVTKGEAARWFNRAANGGIVAALVMYVGAVAQADEKGSASTTAGLAVMAVAGAAFARGMQHWLAEWDNRPVLRKWWHRAELACWVGALAILPLVVRSAWLVLDDRPTKDAPSGTVGGILATLAIAVGYGALLGVAFAAGSTRESLQEHLGEAGSTTS